MYNKGKGKRKVNNEDIASCSTGNTKRNNKGKRKANNEDIASCSSEITKKNKYIRKEGRYTPLKSNAIPKLSINTIHIPDNDIDNDLTEKNSEEIEIIKFDLNNLSRASSVFQNQLNEEHDWIKKNATAEESRVRKLKYSLKLDSDEPLPIVNRINSLSEETRIFLDLIDEQEREIKYLRSMYTQINLECNIIKKRVKNNNERIKKFNLNLNNKLNLLLDKLNRIDRNQDQFKNIIDDNCESSVEENINENVEGQPIMLYSYSDPEDSDSTIVFQNEN